ncbi:MAG TPA: hypothetical protein VKB58_03115 [Terriglobales bacterium]|jgi:hypothetical protein|nr:hypothetical protein [Terriglobales bacterium]
MYFNTNFEPHLSALLFLGTGILLLLLILTSLILCFVKSQWLRYSLWSIGIMLAGYVLLLAGFSLFSHERTLARGQEKYFCELDCHIAYSVQNVERMNQIGNSVANGEYYVVTIRSRFDETTTAPWRPRDLALKPDPLYFSLVDTHGDAVPPSLVGQKAWEASHGMSPDLFRPLHPGESTQAIFVFDVPPGMHSPRLLASIAGFPSPVLIGDETSPLHKKTFFSL